MKIVVYAISKNEEKFAKRWAESMGEADEIYVLDTGSQDKTKEILKECGVIVREKIISPWRFDIARNLSLDLVPLDADICVCTDLDEVFKKGWRKNLEKAWEREKNILGAYEYVWNHLENGDDGIKFHIEKIHSRHGFKWINPVHEVLTYVGDSPLKKIFIPGICLHHFADNSKSRSNYLPLLELAVKENPENDRNMHYLGREYFFNKEYKQAIQTLKKHLSLKTATWNDERCASLRYIAKSYSALQKKTTAEKYFKLACIECPDLREPRLDLAIFYYSKKEYLNCLLVLLDLIKITNRKLNYISEPNCWSSLPHDLASICYYYLGDLKNSLNHALLAFKLEPNNTRIKENICKLTTMLQNST